MSQLNQMIDLGLVSLGQGYLPPAFGPSPFKDAAYSRAG